MKKEYDKDKLFIIAKHIAENDSIWEWYNYCEEFTEEMFDTYFKGKWFSDENIYVESAKELYDKLFSKD